MIITICYISSRILKLFNMNACHRVQSSALIAARLTPTRSGFKILQDTVLITFQVRFKIILILLRKIYDIINFFTKICNNDSYKSYFDNEPYSEKKLKLRALG